MEIKQTPLVSAGFQWVSRMKCDAPHVGRSDFGALGAEDVGPPMSGSSACRPPLG